MVNSKKSSIYLYFLIITFSNETFHALFQHWCIIKVSSKKFIFENVCCLSWKIVKMALMSLRNGSLQLACKTYKIFSIFYLIFSNFTKFIFFVKFTNIRSFSFIRNIYNISYIILLWFYSLLRFYLLYLLIFLYFFVCYSCEVYLELKCLYSDQEWLFVREDASNTSAKRKRQLLRFLSDYNLLSDLRSVRCLRKDSLRLHHLHYTICQQTLVW